MIRSRWFTFTLLVLMPASARLAAAPPVRIVCLGDSVTKAVRPGVSPEETFCAQLERILRAAGRDASVINAGVGGHTTAQGLARFDTDVLRHRPNFVVIMFGLNDSWIDDDKSHSRITVEEYRANLAQMTKQLRQRGVQAILMTPNPAIAPTYPAARNTTMKPYVDAVRDLARQEQLPLVDLYGRLAELALEGAELNRLFTDAMHPNPAGQKLIADMLAERLKALLANAGEPAGKSD